MDTIKLSQQNTHFSSGQKRLSGLEHLVDGKSVLPVHLAEFWQWAYSDLLQNIQRGVLTEFLVKSALDLSGVYVNNDTRSSFEPFDLYGPPMVPPALEGMKVENSTSGADFPTRPSRIEVKSAAYVQSWKPHPNTTPTISFSIAPARLPDETGDFKLDAPKQRNNDLYVFCVYKAVDKSQNILDMFLWEFYVVKTSALNDLYGEQKTVSLNNLTGAVPVSAVSFSNLCDTIVTVCQDISDENKRTYH